MGDFSFDVLILIVWFSFLKLPVQGFLLGEHSQQIQGTVPRNREWQENGIWKCQKFKTETYTHTHACVRMMFSHALSVSHAN